MSKGTYQGILPPDDPLHAFLADEILGHRLGFRYCRPSFEVSMLDVSSTLFRYSDRHTFVNLVCKFYGSKWVKGSQTGEPALRAQLMQREFDNLQQVRSLGLDASPHRVVRPLGLSEALNCVLVEDYVAGPDLDFYILEARDRQEGQQLQECLTDVAWFIADLHNRTRTDERTNAEQALAYLNKKISELVYWEIISKDQQRQLEKICERWELSGMLGQSRQVLIHGDMNPTNFLWSGAHDLTVIDLERLGPGDCAADLGCMAAELKHLFWWYTHNAWAGESYIRHFYSAYADHLPAGVEEFAALTERARFYMGCVELRIGRNSWLDLHYRQQLIEDAIQCLKI